MSQRKIVELGGPKSGKTSRLIATANIERAAGKVVIFYTNDMAIPVLRRRGLSSEIPVLQPPPGAEANEYILIEGEDLTEEDAELALRTVALGDVSWTEETQIALLCDFINRRGLGAELGEFLQAEAAEELDEGPSDEEEDEEDDEGVGYLDPAGDDGYDSNYEDE